MVDTLVWNFLPNDVFLLQNLDMQPSTAAPRQKIPTMDSPSTGQPTLTEDPTTHYSQPLEALAGLSKYQGSCGPWQIRGRGDQLRGPTKHLEGPFNKLFDG